ncbi:MAG: polyprenol monophosphomannose synthase [Nitrospirae bacterium]|nr:polyprenol monophosphomannose synthase [Nitrospirota bacterium]
MILTLVVPTFNEGENTALLVSSVCREMENAGLRDYEILFIDDSTDQTPLLLARLARENPVVRFLHRSGERGLGTAIVRGFSEARGRIVAVMDGDLQHPPSLLPAMMAQIERGADLVVPSRFLPGGSDGGLTLPRKLVSLVARLIARILLSRVRPVSDPTGGVFMARREVLEGVVFDAGSWKILIEILVRGCYGRVAEIPYRFRARDLGTSKMSAAAQMDYLLHLLRLLLGLGPGRRTESCRKRPVFERLSSGPEETSSSPSRPPQGPTVRHGK